MFYFFSIGWIHVKNSAQEETINYSDTSKETGALSFQNNRNSLWSFRIRDREQVRVSVLVKKMTHPHRKIKKKNTQDFPEDFQNKNGRQVKLKGEKGV